MTWKIMAMVLFTRWVVDSMIKIYLDSTSKTPCHDPIFYNLKDWRCLFLRVFGGKFLF